MLATGWIDRAEQIVVVLEVLGVAIIVLGGVAAVVRLAQRAARHQTGLYLDLRVDLARAIVLGLEVLVAADIVRTVVIDLTMEAVAVLALLVFVRIALAWSLAIEIDGIVPWKRWRLAEELPPAQRPPEL